MKKAPLARRVRRALRELMGTGPARREIFAGAQVNRLVLDWVARILSADEEVRGDAKVLRARARQLLRDNAYVIQYASLLVSNVIGTGVRMQAQTKSAAGALAKDTNAAIEAAWKAWTEGPISEDGMMGFAELSELALTTAAIDGELFVRKVRGPQHRHGFALQLIDADLIDLEYNRARGTNTNEIRMGIEIGPDGRRVAYHVWTDYPTSAMGGGTNRKRYAVPAGEMLHLYARRRVGQTRGVTWLSGGMFETNVLGGYEENELTNSRLAATKAGFFETQAGQTVELPTDEAGNPEQPAVMDASPASFSALLPGWTFKSWDPQHPSGTFGPFVKQILRKISAAFRVLYNDLSGDLEGVNYSSMKVGRQPVQDSWRRIQLWWVRSFLAPVFEEWMANALLAGDLALPSRDPRLFSAVKWTPRGWASPDPLKDAQADTIALQNGTTSRTRICAQEGADFEEIVEERRRENELLKAAGLDTALSGAKPPAPDDDEEKPPNGNGEEPERALQAARF